MKLIKNIIKIIIVLLFVTGCGKQTENDNISNGYKFIYQGNVILIGDIYDENTIGVSNTFFENENCAFSEKDITYMYNDFQIQTYENDKKEQIIYSIYFLNEDISTQEGLSIYDSYSDMINIYGNNYINEGNLYSYTKDNTNLNVIIENGIISSIEYCLNDI